MGIVAALVIGAASAALVWLLARDVFTHPTLARRNVRDLDVPTAGGIVLVLALLPGWAAVQVLTGADPPTGSTWWTLVSAYEVVPVVLAFALLGLVDDLLADGDDRGFRGHLGALLSGRLTTGGVKLIGGGLAALALTAGPSLGWHLVDAVVVALAANLANLFDRAPGRVTKVSLLAVGALVAGVAVGASDGDGVVGSLAQDGRLAGTALVIGAAVGLLGAELRERVMLGDTGANPLGAVLGLAVVSLFDRTAVVVVLVVLIGLNLLSEKVSFSRVIAQNRVLAWIDGLGRQRA